MAIQMYLIHPKHNEDDHDRETIAEIVANLRGFILMATSHGSLIVAFDEQYADAVRAHPLVEFVGGVTLDPNAPGAAALQRIFAENVAVQLAERGITRPGTGVAGDPSQPAAGSFPPGYRPLRWPGRDQEGGG